MFCALKITIFAYLETKIHAFVTSMSPKKTSAGENKMEYFVCNLCDGVEERRTVSFNKELFPFVTLRESRECNEVDKVFISTLQDVNNQIKGVNQESKQDDSNSYFCKSLITSMEELTPEQNMLARIKIQKVLFEIKFNKNI